MKKLALFLSTILLSNFVLASTLQLPKKFICTRDNDISSCHADGEIYDFVLSNSGHVMAGEYTLATFLSSVDPNPASLQYSHTFEFGYVSLYLKNNDKKYSAYLVSGSKWYVSGENTYCQGNNPPSCLLYY